MESGEFKRAKKEDGTSTVRFQSKSLNYVISVGCVLFYGDIANRLILAGGQQPSLPRIVTWKGGEWLERRRKAANDRCARRIVVGRF